MSDPYMIADRRMFGTVKVGSITAKERVNVGTYVVTEALIVVRRLTSSVCAPPSVNNVHHHKCDPLGGNSVASGVTREIIPYPASQKEITHLITGSLPWDRDSGTRLIQSPTYT